MARRPDSHSPTPHYRVQPVLPRYLSRMHYAKICCLLMLLTLAATGCFSAKPTRGRPRQLDPDQEVSEPRVVPKDSVIK